MRWLILAVIWLAVPNGSNLAAATLPADFTETSLAGNWSDAVNDTRTSLGLAQSPLVNIDPPGFAAEANSGTDGSGPDFNGATLPLLIGGANTLLIAAWHSEFDGDQPDGWRVECSGVPGTLITDTNGYRGGDGNRRFRIYYWVNPPPGASSILVTNDLYDGDNELAVSAILLTNVAQLGPLGATVLDVSTLARTGESETVDTSAGDLVVHVIADALFTRGTLGSEEISRSVANDGLHTADGDASLWISTKVGEPSTTTVSSSGWASRVINGVAIVVHGSAPGAPGISDIPDQATSVNTPTPAIAFNVGDPDTPATSLTLRGTSSNPNLVPDANIVFGGSDSNRTVTVNPAAGQSGHAIITVEVSDGTQTASDSFVLAVNAGSGGLVAAYGFNEGTGTMVADASGNGNNGTLSGTTWSTAGKYGNALSFDGTSALVTIADAESLHLTNGMTLEAWVNPTAGSSAWRDVIYKGADNYYLMATTSNDGEPGVGGTFAGENPNLYGPSVLALNTWTHLAGTYDGATLRLYVNGVEVSAQPQTGEVLVSENPLQIGGDDIFGQYFQGLIDEVRVYNRALSVSEIQADMNTAVDSPVNTAPTITAIADQTTNEDTPLGPLNFVVGDAETAAGNLTLSGSSSNPGLIPEENISFGGSGSNRTVTVMPAAGQSGTATVTVTVGDGELLSISSFHVTVRNLFLGLTLVDVGRDGVTLEIDGAAGAQVVIEASDDLANWAPIGVITNVTGVSLYTDAEASAHARRWYRLQENP